MEGHQMVLNPVLIILQKVILKNQMYQLNGRFLNLVMVVLLLIL
jgi:hypothetical protein